MVIRCFKNKRRTEQQWKLFTFGGMELLFFQLTKPMFVHQIIFSTHHFLPSCYVLASLVLSSSKSVWGVPEDREINFAPFNSLGEEMIPNILMGKWVKFMNFVSKYSSDYSRSFIHLSDYSFRPQIIFITLLMGI